jgi:DNA-nicking Smr family endonuclease
VAAVHDPLMDVSPDATLDLHGQAAAEAVRSARAFLELWRRRRPGAVIHLITGKGRGAGGRSALRPAIRRAIRDDLQAWVADWCRDENDGGFLVKVR